jgi:hypothetical protein
LPADTPATRLDAALDRLDRAVAAVGRAGRARARQLAALEAAAARALSDMDALLARERLSDGAR